jgi:putative oxidoreductase
MLNSNLNYSPPILNMTDGVAARAQDFLMGAARVLIGWIFVSSGFRKLLDIPAFAATMPRRDLPIFLGYIAPPTEFLGGLFIVFGFATRYSALVMLLFMVIATFSSHRYGNFIDPAQYADQKNNFFKTCR